jgi:hypothetical protein
MSDQRVAALSRNLRTQGYLDNDPDATLVAMRLIVLADALEEQQQLVSSGTPPKKR